MKSITVAVHKIVFGRPCRYFALALREFLSPLAIMEHIIVISGGDAGRQE
ncbi:hypothetical protein [Bradyrhizobium sp. CCBAU 53351]|nr:hypothetical protein [Bradyrhizobium sp. CCBAU 53351]